MIYEILCSVIISSLEIPIFHLDVYLDNVDNYKEMYILHYVHTAGDSYRETIFV